MLNRRTFLASGAALAGTLALTRASHATLSAPTGRVILTVSGAIQASNAPGGAAFDLAMLDALPSRVTRTRTPWVEGVPSFSGPLGSAILQAVGATGRTLKVTALNDYSVTIPVEDFQRFPVILASRINDRPIPVREKGPLFVIYPFDVEPSLYNEATFAKSVWQVRSIEVV